jgi:hypothetical protein
MSELLNGLLGLRGMGFGQSGVEFGFARPIPAWGWALAVLLAGALAGWSYWRLSGERRWRIGLAAGRALVLLLILLVISGPQLVRPNERIENDWVLVLLDRSASMTIADAPDGASGAREPRDQQLRQAITSAWPAFASLAKDRTVQWLGFDSGVYDIPLATSGGQPTGIDPGQPQGRRTALGAAIDQALARAAARPISGVVILSDGRSVDDASRQAIRRLQSERIPVFTVPLGSAEPISDLALQRAEAPAMAFVNDTVPVGVEIERLGAGDRPIPGKVQLLDKLTGRVLDERPLPDDPAAWADHRARVTLTDKPTAPGKFEWVVRVVPDVPDLIQQNNTAELSIELVDRPLRILYFDGYPRWEYRYLKNLLVREHSIQAAALLLASNRQYLREGDLPLDSLPRSPEDWAKFDVVILGDLPASLFSREQLEQLREHIAIRGAGLLWIGGPGSTPGAWRDSPLADLLPFSLAATADGSGPAAGVHAYDEPVVMSPAPAARRLNLLELGETPEEGWPARLSDPATGWSQLQFAQHIDPAWVKPTAEVLANFTPVSVAGATNAAAGGTPSPPPSSTPAVLSMRYGAGRILYVATDEIWRWRYARGEALPERFWLPFLRLQGRESLARSSRPAVLEVSPRRAEVEQPVRLAVRILDQALADAAPARLTARVKRGATATDPATSTDLTLAPEQSQGGAGGGTRAGRSYATTWVPSQPGKYQIEVADPALSGASLSGDLEVLLPDDELRRPEADHALLANLSKQTEEAGGRVLRTADLAKLPDLLPKREVHIAGTPDIQTLWDRPAVFALLLLLLAAEWIGRRLIKLP